MENEMVILPGSKSMAARLLILDYIRGERSVRGGLPECDDTQFLAKAMQDLCRRPSGGSFYLGSGAASLRFFVALVASLEGFEGEIEVSPQLARRPLAPLVDALRSVGAEINYLRNEGYPPLFIKGKKLRGGKVSVNGAVSSQFISAIMMASKLWMTPAEIEIAGKQVSTPYIELTRRMIEASGSCELEADWSAAAFFYEAALLTPGREIRIANLTPPEKSLQGDAGVAGLFHLLGVESDWQENGDVVIKGNKDIIEKMRRLPEPLELDLGSMPDAVPALAVGMAMAGIRYRFINIGHLRHKESNRLEVLKTELEKIGIAADTTQDSLVWSGGRMPMAENEVIECSDDHRIAMAFAPAAARLDYISIRDPECVDKSFPDYFDQLEKIGYIRTGSPFASIRYEGK
ncbi:MAG: hypothetical protein K2G53_03140 [Muribaculaceae bacterium]|nr:hypothetical protein [Muribaculaceae bacterium]